MDLTKFQNYILYRCKEENVDFEKTSLIFEIVIKEIKEFKNEIDLIYAQTELLEYIIGEIKGGLLKDNKKIAEKVLESFELNYSIEKSDISRYSIYITRYLNLVSFLYLINKDKSYNNPEISLVNDLYQTVFEKLKSFSILITNKLYSSALAFWRGIHESECVLNVLNQNNKIKQEYVKHIKYDNYLRNPSAYSKENLDKQFSLLKDEMAEHNLKSKDMKKFIEYGYLYHASNYDQCSLLFKLNFRDGLERLAGLYKYSNLYEGASQVVHSSSSYFYTNEEFCKDLSLALTYQSLIRITDNYVEYMNEYFINNDDKFDTLKRLLREVIDISKILDREINIDDYLI